jgi:hypothetical protein
VPGTFPIQAARISSGVCVDNNVTVPSVPFTAKKRLAFRLFCSWSQFGDSPVRATRPQQWPPGRSRRQFLSEGRERPVLTGGCRAQQHRGPGVVTVVPFLSPCLSLVPRGWGGRHAGCGHSSGKRKRVKGLLMTLGFLQGSGKALVTPLWPQVWEKAQATGPRTLTLRGPSCPSLRPVPPPVGRVGERGTTGLV